MKRSFVTQLLWCAALAGFPILAQDDGPGLGTSYTQTNLVADTAGVAANTDPQLVNAWGVSTLGSGPWWVNAQRTGLSLVYNSTGAPYPAGDPLIVAVPPAAGTSPGSPTGIVSNATSDFQVGSGQPAAFIFCTLDGTISGWNPSASPVTAITRVTTAGAVYTGLAMGQMSGANVLYVANFASGAVEVYDANFAWVTMPAGAFTDPGVPTGYAPFNVQNIGGNIFVAWTSQSSSGTGVGYVDEFSPTGTLLMQFEAGSWLNSPWGIAMAPITFGSLGGRLLVGNLVSGEIAAFNTRNGKFVKMVTDADGQPIVIDGLWGIKFGSGGLSGSPKALFFAAGPSGGAHGLFGTITSSGR